MFCSLIFCTRQIPLALISRLVGVCLSGCSEETSGPVYYPVHGQVLFQSKPVVEGMVFFHPLGDSTAESQLPMAVTDAEGRFSLTTIQPGDGASEGEYAITVELRELRPDGDEMIRDGRNLLPDQYRSPDSSGLKYTVHSGENEVPRLELK